MIDHTRLYRIKMDITHQLKGILIGINQNCPVPPFKNMSCTMPSFVPGSGKLRSNPAHQRSKWNSTYLNSHVNVITHPAIGVQTATVAIQPCGDKSFQLKSIDIVI